MKRRIVFVLIAVLVCVGAASCFTSYTPVPDTAEIVDVLVLHVHAGDTAEDITGQVDTNAVCELLPQIRARRLPSYHIVASAKTAIRFRWYTAIKPYVSASVNRVMRMRSQKVCHRGCISCPAARNFLRCLINNKREEPT